MSEEEQEVARAVDAAVKADIAMAEARRCALASRLMQAR